MSIQLNLPCLISGKIDINNLYDVENGGFSLYINNELINISGINFKIHNSLLSISNYISSNTDTSFKIINNHIYLYPISNDIENFSISLAYPPVENTKVYDVSKLLALTVDTGAKIVNYSYSPIVSNLKWNEITNLVTDKMYYTVLNDQNFSDLINELIMSINLGVISSIKITDNKNIIITNYYDGRTVILYFNDIIIKRYYINRSDYIEGNVNNYKFLSYYSIDKSNINLF